MKKSLLLTSIVAFTLVLTGCWGGGAEELPEDLDSYIKGAFANWQAADSGSFSLDVDGKIDFEDFVNDAGESIDGRTIILNGVLDGKTTENSDGGTDFDFLIDAEGALDSDDPESFSAMIRQLGDTLYFRYDDFPNLNLPEAESINQVAALFQSKWWSIPVPEDVLNQSGVSLFDLPEEDAELTEQEQLLKDLYDETDFFTAVIENGGAKIDGVNSTQFDIEFDKDAFYTYSVRAAEINGSPMTVESQEDFQTALDGLAIDLSVWVANDDQYVTKIVAGLAVEARDDERPGMANLDVELEVSDFGEAVEISVPEGATPFDLGGAGAL